MRAPSSDASPSRRPGPLNSCNTSTCHRRGAVPDRLHGEGMFFAFIHASTCYSPRRCESSQRVRGGQPMRRSLTAVAALAALSLAPAGAFGQAGSQIIGEVTDNTGGILPGVTVEASSPALIEGSRVAISDGAGRYTIVDLRPGTYTVTFTLPGFSVVVVEDQDLPAGFVATVDAVLSVGALEETVTVSGEAPVVDVATTRRVEVLDREVLDAIPTGNNLQSTAQLIPGIKLNRPEVGLTTAAQQTYMSVHGMSVRQTTVAVDGQLVMSSGYDGANQNYN
ncbi:MAG: carboxypeptidase regulatory-like domain-containing protein, partial [Acidobacteria bacterium]|nr:carboxypeptidase regulatory-like domain-containing protein [Acidobacteriota bacterium]